MTQTNVIATRFVARYLVNYTFETDGYEAFGVATLSSLSGLSSILVQQAVPRERRAEFEEAARAAGASGRHYGAAAAQRRSVCAVSPHPADPEWRKQGGEQERARVSFPLQGGSSCSGATSLTLTTPGTSPVRTAESLVRTPLTSRRNDTGAASRSSTQRLRTDALHATASSQAPRRRQTTGRSTFQLSRHSRTCLRLRTESIWTGPQSRSVTRRWRPPSAQARAGSGGSSLRVIYLRRRPRALLFMRF